MAAPVDVAELVGATPLVETDAEIHHRRQLVIADPGDALGNFASTGMTSTSRPGPSPGSGVVGCRADGPPFREERQNVEGGALSEGFAGSVMADRYGPFRAGGGGHGPSRRATRRCPRPNSPSSPRGCRTGRGARAPAAIVRLLAPQQGAEVEALMEDRVGPGLEGQLTVRSEDELTGV